jgi:hypothetical protein
VAFVGGDLDVLTSLVEPGDVAHGGELDVVEPRSGSFGVDQLPLVGAVERLGNRVVRAGSVGAH